MIVDQIILKSPNDQHFVTLKSTHDGKGIQISNSVNSQIIAIKASDTETIIGLYTNAAQDIVVGLKIADETITLITSEEEIPLTATEITDLKVLVEPEE